MVGSQRIVMDAGGSSVKDAVLEAIKQTANNGEQGTTAQEVFEFMSKNNQTNRVGLNEIKKCMQSMSEEGTVYSTVDEEHFMYT